MLVKSVDLSKYDILTEVKHRTIENVLYKKELTMSPSNIVFLDDNYGVTTAMWEAYYRYYYRDGNYGTIDALVNPIQVTKVHLTNLTFSKKDFKDRYGFDNDS